MEQYNFQQVEKKWAQRWIKEKVFTPDLADAKKPYYALFMFPYPSAEGLHIGNFYAFTCVDVTAKYKKLRGYDVFEPFGFDAFGMHLENYALKIGQRPAAVEKRTTANFRRQVQAAGLSCDYTREVDTTSREYYKWTQWIFTKLFERGLAYQKEALLNWCPSCKTVLADEQIEGGVCERCKTAPEKRNMKQWFFRITAYAQRLLDGLNFMDWSDITKAAQRNWIGRSAGAVVKFKVQSAKLKVEEKVEVFTTRPDTLFGATYMVLAPEHSLLQVLKPVIKNWPTVENYIKQAGARSDLERTENKEKTGVKLEGIYAVNPVNSEKIPVFIADYVLTGYGTGAIMAVPAHDERDYVFAQKYGLPIKPVVVGENSKFKIQNSKLRNFDCFTGEGVNINSGFLDGLPTAEAKKKMIAWLEERGVGRGEVTYRLRDWCISRQRYWGPPVPVVYCRKCGAVAVPEKDLPVKLPGLKEGWQPAGDGRGPLAKVDDFIKTTCPQCGGSADREADVMDNFLDSAWYFFRYLSPHSSQEIFSSHLARKWLPVDLYIGGNEHAVLHLMYTRFITMFFHDLGLVGFDNPFKRFRANGMILKDGRKMSKSKGNVVNPEEYGQRVGYDALKTYLLFLGPLSEDRSFTDAGVQGAKRWVEKIFRLREKVCPGRQDDKKVLKKFHQTIKAVTDDFEEQKYNTAVARLMELTNVLAGAEKISSGLWKDFLVLIAPLTPALAEELWAERGYGKSIFQAKNWPQYNPALAREETINLAVQVNGKLRDVIAVAADISAEEAKKAALAGRKIKKWVEGKEIIRMIFIRGKLVNIVTK